MKRLLLFFVLLLNIVILPKGGGRGGGGRSGGFSYSRPSYGTNKSNNNHSKKNENQNINQAPHPIYIGGYHPHHNSNNSNQQQNFNDQDEDAAYDYLDEWHKERIKALENAYYDAEDLKNAHSRLEKEYLINLFTINEWLTAHRQQEKIKNLFTYFVEN